MSGYEAAAGDTNLDETTCTLVQDTIVMCDEMRCDALASFLSSYSSGSGLVIRPALRMHNQSPSTIYLEVDSARFPLGSN
jgi:hypothetical protein